MKYIKEYSQYKEDWRDIVKDHLQVYEDEGRCEFEHGIDNIVTYHIKREISEVESRLLKHNISNYVALDLAKDKYEMIF